METPTGRDDVDRLSVVTSTLIEIATSALDTPAVLRLLLERTAALTGATGSAIELLSEGEMVVHVGSGPIAAHVGLSSRMERSLSGSAVRTGTILRCHDVSKDVRVDPMLYQRLGASSVIVAPIFGKGGIVGTLDAMSAELEQFGDDDVQIMQIMAGLAGVVLARMEVDGSERSGRVALVARQALQDGLTELPNRALFIDRLEQSIRLAKRQENSLAVLLIDLASFQQINDRLGRAAGDEILREIARRLRGTLRASDTVARTEGDTFSVLLPGANAIGAVGTAKKIQRTLSSPYAAGGEEVSLDFRTGVVVYPEHGQDGETLLEHADAALSAARHSAGDYALYV